MTNINKLRICVEQFPNKGLREFHIDRLFVEEGFNRYADDKPQQIKDLERKLDLLPHVKDDTMGRTTKNSVRIEINPVFSWDEACDAVFGVIREHFGISEEHTMTTLLPREPWMDRDYSDKDQGDF